jgi:uncharacterized protein (DUF169 family)
MNASKRLETAIGGRWTGIAFEKNSNLKGNIAKRPMRLCEAIKEAYTSPVVLTKELINRPGALRSLSWSTDEEEMIAEKIAEETGAKVEAIRKLVDNMPRLKAEDSITIGSIPRSGIAVSYTQPVAAMRLVRQWQLKHGSDLNIAASTLMSVCGSIVARAYITGQICMSFGCPDSREHGGIGKDELVVGVPVHLIENMFLLNLTH